MVDRVKRLGRVHEKENPALPAGEGRIKKLIDDTDMIPTILTSQENLLSLVDSRHNAPRDGRRENPVIRVGNAKKAGVRDKACVLFRKEIKKAAVKALEVTVTLSDNLKNSVKEKGSKVESSSPRSEGNTVRTKGRVRKKIRRSSRELLHKRAQKRQGRPKS